MGIFGKLLGKKEAKPKEFDLGNGMFANEKGNVYGELELTGSLNAKVQINTTVEKLDAWLDRNEANKANPNSCEREPNKDEIKFPLKDFDKYKPVIYEFENIYRKSYSFEGYNNIIISKKEYEELLLRFQQYNDSIKLRDKVYKLLAEAYQSEKSGDIDHAIKIYHKVIDMGYNGAGYGKNQPYERLMILYRKNKDIDNEIKIIEQAVTVFLEENNKQAFSAIEKNPDKKDQILNSITTCTKVLGNDGFLCFNPYNVIKYRERLLKLKNKYGNNKH
jgi:hypothetical protein